MRRAWRGRDDGKTAGDKHEAGASDRGRRKKSGIQVIVNYETSYYPGNWETYSMVHDEHQIGDIRRIAVHDGHRGPKEIGCSTNFLA